MGPGPLLQYRVRRTTQHERHRWLHACTQHNVGGCQLAACASGAFARITTAAVCARRCGRARGFGHTYTAGVSCARCPARQTTRWLAADLRSVVAHAKAQACWREGLSGRAAQHTARHSNGSAAPATPRWATPPNTSRQSEHLYSIHHNDNLPQAQFAIPTRRIWVSPTPHYYFLLYPKAWPVYVYIQLLLIYEHIQVTIETRRM